MDHNGLDFLPSLFAEQPSQLAGSSASIPQELWMSRLVITKLTNELVSFSERINRAEHLVVVEGKDLRRHQDAVGPTQAFFRFPILGSGGSIGRVSAPGYGP